MSKTIDHALGAYERHVRRISENPALFPNRKISIADAVQAQDKDQAEFEQAQKELVVLVQQVIDLDAKADSQIILDLKSELERVYTWIASLGGDQQKNKDAIKKLINVMISTIRAQAGNDSLALQEMEMEQQARDEHFRLLEFPLIADLLREQTSIPADDLAATILCEDQAAVELALGFFNGMELTELAEAALKIHQDLNQNSQWKDQYQANFDTLHSSLEQLLSQKQ